ncbi:MULTISPECIES: PP2C family protein-serine/threonine phosphatase [unclassified Streptomyces]|uniref:PP2C family protein-serine/threonine phosphatase n=1 Tax=unclassified Streptomyces TaxID=2593676 RepID=UPI002E2AD45B|nr:PP2C family protein-serine/threonine phosphatase [Streptomyces sp. NBC_00223]
MTQPSGRSRLVIIPFALIAMITVADSLAPENIHLSPLLAVAPALTAAVSGPRVTALSGVLAVGAQAFIGQFGSEPGTANHVSQLIALTVLSTLVFFVCLVRERRSRELNQARSVAETAQRVLLRPPPRRIGPLRVAWLYLSAEDETEIGGDLFAVARGPDCGTRAIIGDVRGHGLASIGEASVVLGAFREGAHRHAALPGLVTALDESVCRNLEDVADTRYDPGEHFITALVLDLPDDGSQAEMINCGHPPPLLVRDREVTVLSASRPAPPLGLYGGLSGSGPGPGPGLGADLRTDQFALEPGDILVLYTDGVIEARSPEGVFYPLAERVATFPATHPADLLNRIHHDLIDHIGGEPVDDAALLVIERTQAHYPY